MGDLIDRQMVIDAVLRVAQTCPAEFENLGDAKMGYIAAIQSIYHEFKAISSEQPEIIRCRECKYAEVADKEDSQDGYTCQFHRGSIWFGGSYCSWAEHREVDDGDTN